MDADGWDGEGKVRTGPGRPRPLHLRFRRPLPTHWSVLWPCGKVGGEVWLPVAFCNPNTYVFRSALRTRHFPVWQWLACICVCVCACVCVCTNTSEIMCACVRTCVRACMCVWERERERETNRSSPEASWWARIIGFASGQHFRASPDQMWIQSSMFTVQGVYPCFLQPFCNQSLHNYDNALSWAGVSCSCVRVPVCLLV